MPWGVFSGRGLVGFLGRRDDGVEGAVAVEYAKSITLDLPYDQAVPKVKDAFKAQGFTPEVA